MRLRQWCSVYLFVIWGLTQCSLTSTSSPILFYTRSPRPWSEKNPPWRFFWQEYQESRHTGNHVARVTMESSFMNVTGPTSSHPNTEAQFTCVEGKGCLSTYTGGWLRVCGLITWLLILFYLLGTTASDYFSCTLENLSSELKLSPAVAGVSLLAIGNGAPDVFSSVAAFLSADKSGSVGFSCVLGGALFITTVVSGTVALVTAKSCKAEFIRIGFMYFVRDVLFLLSTSAVLVMILLDGKVHLWEAIAFLFLYAIYAIVVIAGEVIQKEEAPLLEPFLSKLENETSLLQWRRFSAEPHHHYHIPVEELDEEDAECLMENSRTGSTHVAKLKFILLTIYLHCVAQPLAIPRQLTIPVIEKERWSRSLAVSSCFLAPIFVGAMWALKYSASVTSSLWVLGGAVVLAIILGFLALFNTERIRPPHQNTWLWLLAGFIMSVVWFYLIADELVATLEALGLFFGINPAILGLTVLAWGNSIGDLVADLALACSGRDGVQIAISGCYAGPLFNMVVGLGLSLIVACWKSGTEPFIIIDDNGSLFYIIGFLVAGLIWSLVIMPSKGMILSRSMGFGLLFIYASFLATGICYIMGWISQ